MATRAWILAAALTALAPAWAGADEVGRTRYGSTVQFLAPGPAPSGQDAAPDEEPFLPPAPGTAPGEELLEPGAEEDSGRDARDEVDLAIKSIRGVRTAIAPAPAFDDRGQRVADPVDRSSRLESGAAIVYASEYGPNWINYSRYPDVWGYCHRPLYFEELNLERYGNSLGLIQPVISGAHFFGTVPALPYLATVEKPWRCYGPEPWYPPAGVDAPWQPAKRYPLRLDATAVQAATVVGLIILIP